VLVGAKHARGKGARSETSDVIYRYFFEGLGLQSASCAVVATNETILRVMDHDGWVYERTTSKPAASGRGYVELRHFRLTRDTWQRLESERARKVTN
jgi:hypothetical protein